MQSQMTIFIAYCIGMKKRPSNIVEFCNSCWKTAKTHLLYNVACKKFSWSGQRGAIAPCPPKYATGQPIGSRQRRIVQSPTLYDLPFCHNTARLAYYSALWLSKVIQGQWFSCHLKASVWLPISNQYQPRPYLAPFNHNTSVTDRQTDRLTDRQTTIVL